MDEPVILVERRHDGVALVTLNRPSKRNALNVELAGAVVDTVTALQDCRCIVVTGADPAFCAGLDLRDLGTDQLARPAAVRRRRARPRPSRRSPP